MRCKTCGRKLYWVPNGAERASHCKDCEYAPYNENLRLETGFIILFCCAVGMFVGFVWIAIRGILWVTGM